MKRFASGKKFLKDIIRILGLDPEELPIVDIIISANTDDVPRATITMLIQEEQTREIVKAVERENLRRPSDEVIGEHS
jgi:hypothetical protein